MCRCATHSPSVYIFKSSTLHGLIHRDALGAVRPYPMTSLKVTMCNQEGTSGHEARRSGAEHPLGWPCGSSMLGNLCGTAAKVRGRQILCSDMGIRHQLDARKQEVASDRVAAAYACRTRTKCLNEVGLVSTELHLLLRPYHC